MNIKTASLALASVWRNRLSEKKLFLISEPADWSIYEDCRNIQRKLAEIIPLEISYLPWGLKNKVIHFASENTLVGKNVLKNKKWYEKIHPSNRITLTWFHISDQDASRLHLIPLLNEVVDTVHTASQNTKRKLIANGLREDKVTVIPLGVDLQLYRPATATEKLAMREKLNIPPDVFVIGSFQKDGIGWGEGLEPKLIKGPDIFCDVVEQLAKQYPVHILLTGPARGYVKNRLSAKGIPFTHRYLERYEDVARFYRALDLYLVTSREEGGPKALLGSLASGIPLVTTNVGMVPEVLIDGVNGFVVLDGTVSTFGEKIKTLIESPETRTGIIRSGLETIARYDLGKTARDMYAQLYKPLLGKL